MRAMITAIKGLVGKKVSLAVLALAAAGGLAAPTSALAGDRPRVDVDLNIRLGDRGHDHDHDHYDRGRGGPERVWVPAVYRTVSDRQWCPPAYETRCERVWVEPVFQVRETRVYDRYCNRWVVRTERVCVSEGRWTEVPRQVCVREGHWDYVTRQELACEGHWEVRDGRRAETYQRRPIEVVNPQIRF